MNQPDIIMNNPELKTKTLESIYADDAERYDQIATESKKKIQKLGRKGLFLNIAIVVSVLVMVAHTSFLLCHRAVISMTSLFFTLCIMFCSIVFCLLSNKNDNMIGQSEIPDQIQDSYVLMNAAYIIGMSLEGVIYVRYENNNHEVLDYYLKTRLTKVRKTDIDHYILDFNKSVIYIPYIK